MNFLEQLKDLNSQVKANISLGKLPDFTNIVIAGMGGSGIAGSIFSEIYDQVPVQVVSDYRIPQYAGKNTLFIGISYSGNTEETIQASQEAIKRGCKVKLVTSGGRLSEIGEDVTRVPGGLQPRSAIGYLLKPFLSSFISDSEEEYNKISHILKTMDEDNKQQKILAEEIVKAKQIPVVYGHYPYRWIAYRWKTQFNENSKLLGYSTFFPELNHNETVPLRGTYGKENFRFFTFGDAPDSITKRMIITSEITDTEFTRIETVGETLLQKLFYLIHYGDYLSYHIALERNIDPEEVNIITELKERLAGK